MSNDDVFVGSSEGSFDDTFGSWRAVVSYSLAVFCLAVCCVSMVFVAVITTTRKFTYNIYIVFLLLPDALLTLVLGIRCIYDGALNNSSTNPPLSLCIAEQIGIGFYISNVILNSIVSRELYTLVNNSYHRKRTQPPTLRKIVCQVAIAYGIASICVLWRLLPVDWAEKTIENDPYCTVIPRANETAAVALFSLLLGPPVVVVLWTYDRMTRGRLLPRNGRTRALALYFMRIFCLFLFIYLPLTIVGTFYYQFDEDRWDSAIYFCLLAVFTLFIPMTTAINLAIFWQKDDIQQSFYHYASIIYSWISVKAGDDGATDSAPAFKIKRKSVWMQHDTYEREGGGLAVVTYLDVESDCDDDVSDNGREMRMWMSQPFTLREVSAATETTATEAGVDRATAMTASFSPVPTARSNVMSMLSASVHAPPVTNGVEELRNLDYFNFNTQTV